MNRGRVLVLATGIVMTVALVVAVGLVLTRTRAPAIRAGEAG